MTKTELHPSSWTAIATKRAGWMKTLFTNSEAYWCKTVTRRWQNKEHHASSKATNAISSKAMKCHRYHYPTKLTDANKLPIDYKRQHNMQTPAQHATLPVVSKGQTNTIPFSKISKRVWHGLAPILHHGSLMLINVQWCGVVAWKSWLVVSEAQRGQGSSPNWDPRDWC